MAAAAESLLRLLGSSRRKFLLSLSYRLLFLLSWSDWIWSSFVLAGLVLFWAATFTPGSVSFSWIEARLAWGFCIGTSAVVGSGLADLLDQILVVGCAAASLAAMVGWRGRPPDMIGQLGLPLFILGLITWPIFCWARDEVFGPHSRFDGKWAIYQFWVLREGALPPSSIT